MDRDSQQLLILGVVGAGIAWMISQMVGGNSSDLVPGPWVLSDNGLDNIQQNEGLRLTVYKDVAGNATIGYGHLLQPGENYTNITENQATALLQSDVAPVVAAINNMVAVPLSQAMFDSLVDFAFNEGIGAFTSSTLLADLNQGDYQSVALQFAQWDLAGGQVIPALQARRAQEAEPFENA